jgi:hypothetical protein
VTDIPDRVAGAHRKIDAMTIARTRGRGSATSRALLERLARRYIWWQAPEESLRNPDRIIAQVMDLGTWEDVRALERRFGRRRLMVVLLRAEAGWFRPRSWAFWSARLFGPEVHVPPAPKRRIP